MVKTLEKTFAILDALREAGPSGTTDLAERLELPRSTIHHHLQMLESHRYVVNNGGTYRLALRFLETGQQIRHENKLFTVGQSEINELTDSIGYPVGMYVKEHKSAVVLLRAGIDTTISISLYPGRHLPIYATAAGKVLLSSALGESRTAKLEDLSLELEEYTENTITTPEKLAADIRATNERGYAIATGERWDDRCSVAVPVQGGGAQPAALEVAVPSDEFDESTLEILRTELLQTVNVIEIKSGYPE